MVSYAAETTDGLSRPRKYDDGMSAKVRKTVTVDQEPVEELAADSASLSSTVNRLLWDEVDRRRRLDALGTWVERLDAEFGPADPQLVREFEELLA